MVFLLFVYSNSFQFILPKLPVDLTYVWLALSIGIGGVVILREGIYLRGLLLAAAILPWLVWVNLSSMWTPSTVQVWAYLKLINVVNLWCLIAGAMIVSHHRERMLRFFKITIVFSLIIAFVGVGIYLMYGSFKFADWDDGGRVYNNWGRAVANGAVILTLLALRASMFSIRQIITGGLLGMCLLFILVSSSRSALLSILTPCVLYFAVMLAPAGRDGLKMKLGTILLPLAMVGVVAIVMVAIASGYRVDTVERLGKVVAQADDPDMVTGANRWAYYAAAIDLFLKAPVIGNGARSFAPLYKHSEWIGVQPHNIFLEIMSETGLVGLVLFLFFLYVALRSLSIQRLRADPLLLAASMLFVSRFTAVQFGEDISGQQEIFIFIGLLALRAAAPAAAHTPAGSGAALPASSSRSYGAGAGRHRIQ